MGLLQLVATFKQMCVGTKGLLHRRQSDTRQTQCTGQMHSLRISHQYLLSILSMKLSFVNNYSHCSLIGCDTL
jgi:hypothetical protein